MSKVKSVKIGVFIPGEAQLLDTACVDVLGMMGKEYLGLIDLIPDHVRAVAPSVDILYITSAANNSIIPLSAGMKVRATHDVSHADVQPGKLDVVLVPGPDPNADWEDSALDFLRGHAECATTDVLSVCTGIFLCGAAGILGEKTVCGPRGLQANLKKKYPCTKFVGERYRWFQDGRFWSSGGITNGNDLVAAYARSSKHFPGPVVELVCKMADVGDRAQRLSESQTAFTISVLWQIVRAWFVRRR